jgi:hypothetical protein
MSDADGKPGEPNETLSITIDEAARMVGMSRAQFYRLYLDAGRIQTVPLGRRRRMIDVKELRRAYAQYVIDARECP